MASRWSAGRRRARRARGPAHPGTPTPSLKLGSRNLGAFTPADRKAGEGSFASSLAPPGAPSPRGENGKQGNAPPPGPKKPGVGAAERWLNAFRLLKIESVLRGTCNIIPPTWGRVAEAEAIAERGRVGTDFEVGFTPPRRSLRSRPPSPKPGRDGALLDEVFAPKTASLKFN